MGNRASSSAKKESKQPKQPLHPLDQLQQEQKLQRPKNEIQFSIRGGTSLRPLTHTSTSPLTETTRSASDANQTSSSFRGVVGVLSDNGSEKSSLRSGGSSTTDRAPPVRAASLQKNVMRIQHRDPLEIYELMTVIGEGSMGSVCKVRKRVEAVGGSARPAFVKSHSMHSADGENSGNRHCCLPIVGHIHRLFPNSVRPAVLEGEEESEPKATLESKLSTLTANSYNTPMIVYSSGSSKRKDYFYALKSIHLDKCGSDQLQQELRNEVAILRELDHAHIARAIETFAIHERLFIVLELCSGGDLYARDPYTEEAAGEIIASILWAISYLHSKGIIHRDLKFENIMFVDKRPESEVKIIDFGLSQKFANDKDLSDAVGTIYTMAPELLTGNYNSKADVWSVGVIAFMLLSSSMPFYGATRFEVMKRICKGNLKFSARRWKKVSKYGKGVVRYLLEMNPNDRPSADRALKYTRTWMRQLNPEEQKIDGSVSTPQSEIERRQLRWKLNSTGSKEEHVEMMDKIQASIQAFSQYSTLKKLALMVIAYKSTASEIGWLRTIFNRFDILQNGEISLEEFSEALSENYDYSKEEMEVLFNGMDVDGTGHVHYTEFLAATIEAHGAIEEERIAEAFDRIDCDDSGYITIENLRELMGDDVPDCYLERIIDEADILQDKRISYPEFLQLWDTACHDNLLQAQAEVADRRMKRARTLTLSFSDVESSVTSDESDDVDEDQFEMPGLEDLEQPQDPKREMLHDYDTLPTTGIPNQSHRYGSVDCFSQRKALSLRVGWQ